MHHLYQTKALICGSKNDREADRFIFLFTEELGMIGASAQGVRLLKSKLRYHLKDASLITVSLVRGKNSWRITGALEEQNYFRLFSEFPEKKELVARIFQFLRRLMPGEEKNGPLFELVCKAFTFLSAKPYSKEILEHFEYLLVLRILFHLGYGSNKVMFDDGGRNTEWSEATIEKLMPYRSEVIKAINESIQSAHL